MIYKTHMFLKKKSLTNISEQYFKSIILSSTVNCILISITATLMIYSVFYFFSEAIWSQYYHIDPMLLAPHVRGWLDHDGIETYIMYTLVFFNLCIALSMFFFHQYLCKRYPEGYNKFLLFSLIPLFITCSVIFFYRAGFNPPISEVGSPKHIFLSEIIVLLSIILLLIIARLPERWSLLIIALVLIPICFLATSPLSTFDYGFIFSPALRLIHGFGIKEIYFQYDLFLSLLAAAWLKLNFDFNHFRLVAQTSIYALILAEFILAKRLFFNKKLAYYFLAALVLVKIYAYFIDPSYCIQLTPLRLDFWVVPFIILMWRGSYSLGIGCSVFLINIVHRNFGFLYTLSYLEFIFVLFVIDIFENNTNKSSIIKSIKKHVLLTYPNLLLISLSLCVDYYIFGSLIPESALLYQQLGIGFMRISAISFYWYIPILFAATFILLISQRKTLSNFYFNSGIFLILLSLANSTYFFGRSHESNIIHISGSILFLAFLFIDLLCSKYETTSESISATDKSSKYKNILGFAPIFLVMLMTYFYSERIIRNLFIHAQNLSTLKLQYPIPYDKDTTNIKTITHNSDKVYILSQWDFYYYYFGNYIPPGYYLPYVSWPYKKDLVLFLKNLLNKHYYIVIRQDEMRYEHEIINSLSYSHTTNDDTYKVIWK